jgi:excisionase family DNA binding protein
VALPPEHIVPAWFDEWFDAVFPPELSKMHPTEVARRLRLHHSTVYELVEEGSLPARRRGDLIEIRRTDLRAWCLARLLINIES